MGRWEPGASGRLRQAAMELFIERGYEQTTVAEIAGRAGVTARTFFRYFADKREVLFAGSLELQQQLVAAVDNANPAASPMQAVAAAPDTPPAPLRPHPDFSPPRPQGIAAQAQPRGPG